MQDLKMVDQVAEGENEGPSKSCGMKMQGMKIQGIKLQDLKLQELK